MTVTTQRIVCDACPVTLNVNAPFVVSANTSAFQFELGRVKIVLLLLPTNAVDPAVESRMTNPSILYDALLPVTSVRLPTINAV